jgi:dihydropteroate synthase
VAGRADLAFATLEHLHRHADGVVDRRIASLAEIQAEIERGGRKAEQLRSALAALTRPRPSVAGLALDRPRLMGIVNVTPDSFSDGGTFSTASDAIRFARQLADEGADFLDIGGESTRPGSDPVPLDEELRRVMPVIEGLVGRVTARLSIDTRKPEVMRRAALAGVHMINDVSALSYDPASLRVAAETRLPVVLMHARGDPKTMQKDPRYDNVLLDVFDEMAARIEAATRAGIPPERLLVDPGIGFGKSLTHNLELLAGLSLFHTLGVGILLGASRKSFIGRLSGAVDPADRVPGSLAAALGGAMQGAAILRVHDVAATRQALAVFEAATLGGPPPGVSA